MTQDGFQSRKSCFLFFLISLIVSSGAFASNNKFCRGVLFKDGEKSYGYLDDKEAAVTERVVAQFYFLVKSEELDKAYSLLSHKLRDEHLTLIEFMTEIEYLRKNYGVEKAFIPIDPPPDEGKLIDNPPQSTDVLAYYNSVMFYYLSQRDKKVVMSFGVVNEDGKPKIGLWGYIVPDDKVNAQYNSIPHK